MIGDFSVAHFVFLGFSPPDARDVELRGAKRRNGYCEFGFGRFAGVEQDPRAYRDPRAARCGSSVRQLGAAALRARRARPRLAAPARLSPTWCDRSWRRRRRRRRRRRPGLRRRGVWRRRGAGGAFTRPPRVSHRVCTLWDPQGQKAKRRESKLLTANWRLECAGSSSSVGPLIPRPPRGYSTLFIY